MFLPNGTHIFNKLQSFLRVQYRRYGFQEVLTPTIYKKSLWEQSGHWDNYKDDMYSVVGRGASGHKENTEIGEDEEYGLKPMNCPGHCLLFKSETRSYRDLPVRYADFSPLHRNEVSGALTGLTRVRRFHQDDGHIFCRPSQISEEISRTLDFVSLAMKTFGLGPFKLVLSTRPEKDFIGTEAEWERAESQLREALNKNGKDWELNPGDGAFYGPKIDIILKDANGKEHQTATIQLDFQLPQRFGLEYVAPSDQDSDVRSKDLVPSDSHMGRSTPVLIHRAIFGSLERFMALLIEHYNGHWPFWLSPRQVIILSVNQSPELIDAIHNLKERISNVLVENAGPGKKLAMTDPIPLNHQYFMVDTDTSARELKKKVAEAKHKRYNLIIVCGPKDLQEAKTLSTAGDQEHDLLGQVRFSVDIKGQLRSLETMDVLTQQLNKTGDLKNSRAIRMNEEELRKFMMALNDQYL
ncbi:MAG: hypothetical protein M1834_006943 [Cirrosporium novae-zelandiae]|nr:MAG: hypothetical protein M1834_006943 [Cirrosporium novae-zelandiae]